MRPTFFLLPCLLLLVSCSNYILDPVLRDQSSNSPGELWDPNESSWYCPRTAEISSSEILTNTKEFDIAALLNMALENHPATKQAWAQARAEAFAVGAAESSYYPAFTGSESVVIDDFNSSGSNVSSSGRVVGGGENDPLGTQLQNDQSQGGFGSTKSLVSNLSISYLILDFGGREASVKSTRYALESLNWTQNRTIQQVIFNVLQGYYLYIDSKEILKAKREDLKNAEVNLNSAETLYQVGIGRRLDFLQAKSNLANSRLAVVTAESQVKINLGGLAVALGMSPSATLEVKDLPEYFPVKKMTEEVDELMAIAKRNRPDLAAAYALILQKKMDYLSAVSSSLPTLNANVNLQNVYYFSNSGRTGNNVNGVLSLNFPIFNGFLYANLIKQAQENIKAAKANFDNIESLALLDVILGYYNFISAKESVEVSQEYLVYAQEAYDLALATYQTGTGTMLDLLSAQASLSDARSQKIHSKTSWATSLFNIAYVTGVLNTLFVVKEMREEPNNKGDK